jgi:hypothetical protein
MVGSGAGNVWPGRGILQRLSATAQPQENFAFGRTFRIGEKGRTFNIRAEFSNIFNRARLPNQIGHQRFGQPDICGCRWANITLRTLGHVDGKWRRFGFINTASLPRRPLRGRAPSSAVSRSGEGTQEAQEAQKEAEFLLAFLLNTKTQNTKATKKPASADFVRQLFVAFDLCLCV